MQALAIPAEREGVAADAVHRGLDHGQHGRGGDGGVNGVAARGEHGETGLGGERLRRRDHLPAQGRHPLGRVGKPDVDLDLGPAGDLGGTRTDACARRLAP